MKNNKLRIQYVLFGAIIGCLMALLFAIVATYSPFLDSWISIVINIWPWAENLDYLFYVSLFLTLVFGCMISGFRYAIKLERNSDEALVSAQTKKHKKIVRIALIILVVILLVFFARYLIKLVQHQANQKIAKELIPSLPKLKTIQLFQEGDKIRVLIETIPPYNGKYQLVLNFKAQGFAQCPLMGLVQTIPENSDKKNFEFEIPFKDLEKSYREELTSYVEDLTEPMGIDEMIGVTAVLELFETQTIKRAKVLQLGLPYSKLEGIALFYFKCSEQECKIEQNKGEGEKEID